MDLLFQAGKQMHLSFEMDIQGLAMIPSRVAAVFEKNDKAVSYMARQVKDSMWEVTVADLSRDFDDSVNMSIQVILNNQIFTPLRGNVSIVDDQVENVDAPQSTKVPPKLVQADKQDEQLSVNEKADTPVPDSPFFKVPTLGADKKKMSIMKMLEPDSPNRQPAVADQLAPAEIAPAEIAPVEIEPTRTVDAELDVTEPEFPPAADSEQPPTQEIVAADEPDAELEVVEPDAIEPEVVEPTIDVATIEPIELVPVKKTSILKALEPVALQTQREKPHHQAIAPLTTPKKAADPEPVVPIILAPKPSAVKIKPKDFSLLHNAVQDAPPVKISKPVVSESIPRKSNSRSVPFSIKRTGTVYR